MSVSQAKKRLERALKQLELARVSRELDYGAVPYVVSAEELIRMAILRQTNNHG